MKISSVLLAAGLAAGLSGSALGATVSQINPTFTPVRADVTAGAFPIGGGLVSGQLTLSQKSGTFFQINTINGSFFPGAVVSSIVATIDIVNNNVTSASFAVLMTDSSGFTAVGGNGLGVDLIWENGAYSVRGSISNFLLSGPSLAGVDVSAAYNAQPLSGSFFNFSFTPNTQAGGVGDFDDSTQLAFDVQGRTIPLPTPVGMASIGLIGLGAIRRRRA